MFPLTALPMGVKIRCPGHMIIPHYYSRFFSTASHSHLLLLLISSPKFYSQGKKTYFCVDIHRWLSYHYSIFPGNLPQSTEYPPCCALQSPTPLSPLPLKEQAFMCIVLQLFVQERLSHPPPITETFNHSVAVNPCNSKEYCLHCMSLYDMIQ